MRGTRISPVAVGLMLAALACGSRSDEARVETDAAATGGGLKVDPATAGEIKGLVVLDGPAPQNDVIRMNADPVCMREAPGPQRMETFIVGEDGKSLANVFVYVKDGLGNYAFDPPAGKVTLDQRQCRYLPHVLGVRVGQPLEVVNSDPTLHNIHAIPQTNQEFNHGQPIQGLRTSHAFTRKEVMIPFKCDVHGWMSAYVGVVDNPYFATTERDGRFALKGLPPGTYTLEAWHEKLGPQTQTVTLGPQDVKEVTFAFTAAPARAN